MDVAAFFTVQIDQDFLLAAIFGQRWKAGNFRVLAGAREHVVKVALLTHGCRMDLVLGVGEVDRQVPVLSHVGVVKLVRFRVEIADAFALVRFQAR